ncbi:MAG TPA: SDR family NAD(P)-dependent oxidoreductase [Dehalococcoidia bacterium]|jgi:NAD(P)-dependent dehydrogenase (short-subunit alcohol dehydrogenase family)|nr:SDR family NAD(P)-dependent oxidoreductase [Dehalococcoidia bacterium]MDP7262356.1 SDR family NAD(P)-dependent oxidoreductase [Dehalococcoidia bacterium]MDP7484509.1 SDR family NAD(P)-dependent oxidoreductase [Dehalococcoidia bacterium]HJP28831.1 SDR family NAD(P)-dependent oxidoreductase [Dehalococcoidia bacterium]|tara:strand:+ start:8450 stop:9250 length:801 start_codon:yes stop_codon:yes gene_type:complete
MDLKLLGKRAIVTGGSRGIGKAIARMLAEEGVIVVIASRGKEALDATAEELTNETGSTVTGVVADTGSDNSVRSLIAAAKSIMGGIDILVNCAARPGGQSTVSTLAEVTTEEFNDHMNVKVMGYLRCAREVAPVMTEQNCGRIINISGLASRSTGTVVGSMRNVAVSAMTKNLADELGPSGINVTVIHPGMTRTEATERVVADRAEAEGVSEEEIESRMAQGNSSRTIIDASDIAYVVTMLASPLSIAVNGDGIAAGGGVGTAIYY